MYVTTHQNLPTRQTRDAHKDHDIGAFKNYNKTVEWVVRVKKWENLGNLTF